MSGQESITSTRKRDTAQIMWLVAIVVAAVVPYLASLKGGFALDDNDLIVRDPLAHTIRNFPQCFSTDFLRGFLGETLAYYRPLVTGSFQLNYTLSGPNPLASTSSISM